MKKAREAAQVPVTIVLLTGTCVVLWTSEKNDGNRPSRAMAINILGCEGITMWKYKYPYTYVG